MHPAFSVIFFTVTSGIGYGLFIILALLGMYGGAEASLSITTTLTTGLLALGMITAGLISSSFHLANPKNAWRAFSRFRTSWLSREAWFAVFFYGPAVLYLLLLWMGAADDGSTEQTALTRLLGWAAIFLGLITVFSTGMIYACLKTIRQWNTSLVPANYIALGLAGGAVIMIAVLVGFGLNTTDLLPHALGMLGIALLLKLMYFAWIGKPAGPSINTATSFTRATVRLLDVGHTAGTFLTEEFGYEVAVVKLLWLRIFSVIFAFVVPLILLTQMTMSDLPLAVAIIAPISMYLGLVMERWLFFAEARHVVNLYHGAQRT